MRKFLPILPLIAACLTLGAVAVQADVPDATSGEITACLNGEHAVRIIDTDTSTCDSGETELSWLSRGGAVYEDHTVAAQTITGGATVASITVPAGRYVVTAKTAIEDLSGSANFVQCGLVGDPFNTVNEGAQTTVPANGFDSQTVHAAVEIAISDTFELFCNPTSSAEAAFTVLTATSVSSRDAQ